MAFAALVIDLTAKLTNLQQGMDRAVKISEDSAKRIQNAFSFGGAAKAGAGFFAAQLGLESLRDAATKVKELSDEWTRTRVLIENVTRGIDDATYAQKRLYEAAQATRQNYGELSKSFASFARNAGELGISTEEAVGLQTTVAQAIALSGARADSAASALVQFGQGIASGTLRGEELNSVLEQTPKLARAIADGMGVPLKTLIAMGKEGELTADKIIAALQKVAPKMQEEFSKVTPTIGDAFTAVNNSLGNLLSGLNNILPVADTIASLLIKAANAVDKVANMLKSGGNSTSMAVNEADAIRSLIDRVRPYTDEKFLVEDFKKKNKGMAVDMEAIREQARLYKEQLKELEAQLREFERQFDRQGMGPNGQVLPSMSELDAQAEAKREERRIAALKKYGDILLKNRGISNSFLKDVKELQEAFDGADFNDPKVRNDYNTMYHDLLKRSGFFPEGKKENLPNPLDWFVKDAEKRWDELDKWREGVLKILDPTHDLRVELERINALQKVGALTSSQAAEATAITEAQIDELKKRKDREKLLRDEPLTEVREALNEYIAQLRIEADTLGMSEIEREARVKLLDAEKKGLENTSAEWARYKDEIERALGAKKLAEVDAKKGGTADGRTELLRLAAEDLQNKLDEINAMGGGDTERWIQEWKDRAAVILGTTQLAKDEAYKLGEAFQSAFEKAVVGGESLSDVLKALAKDIAMMFIRQQFTAPMAAAINSSSKGAFGGDTLFATLGSWLSGLGGGGSDFVGPPAPRAGGGLVGAGQTYMVGEKGMELFTPSMSGRIVPSSKFGGGVSVVNNITVSGEVSRADVYNAAAMAEARTRAFILDNMGRNGAFKG